MPMYKDQRGFTDSLNNQKYFDQKYLDKDPGPFIATVKFPNDPTRMGRLGVNIPALTGTTDPSPEQIIWCQYLSPFYGVKPLQSVSKTDPYTYTASQTSYGMWAVPPDVDTTVLVIFAKGQQDRYNAFWMGCVQEPYTNAQIPGHAASRDTAMPSNGGDYGESKQDTYGTDILPTGEKNRGIKAETLDQQKFPINERLAAQLMAQGLIADRYRGTTTSSARRESPSAVFGISTPGRIKPDSKKPNIGLNNSPVSVDRDHGHSFVMDDGARDGTNQLVRMRTASGHQLLMHDTEGVVYIANGSGNAWIEMQSNGRIDVYSGIGGINLRTEGDFNLHSDTNINLHAGQSIRMSASGTDEVKYKEDDVAVQKGLKTTNDVKIPKIPGQIIQSTDYHQTLGDKGVFVSSQDGVIQHYGNKGITSYSGGQQLHGAKGQFHLAGAQVHFNSTGASPDWGPTWMTTDATGMTPRLEGDVELAQKGIKPLEQFTRKTKTTVHRFVTHEPMFRASVIGNDGIIPIDPDDKKQWYRLSSTPGTAEYINMQNRLSPNSAIRDAQYQADALEYVKQKMGSSTDAIKARQLLTEFGTKYNEIYGITDRINLPFDIKDSISEKIKGIDFNTPAKDLINSLSSQVVEKFTGKSTELFKDNVFVNQAGQLFTLGNNTVSGISGNIDLANNALNSVQGLTKNLSVGNLPATIANLNSITQTYSSVVGGKIVGMNQVKSLASKAGLFNARDASRLGQSFLQNVGVNLSSKIGAIGGAVKKFFKF